MSCTFSLQIPRALPSPSPPRRKAASSRFLIISEHKTTSISTKFEKLKDQFDVKKASLAVQIGALLTTFEQPALALTGVNHLAEQDLGKLLIEFGFILAWYFLIMPPIIMNWLRIRWYKRNLLEMYFQFMFVFMFFPGLMLWAPFLNFRKFPRDPDMKNPWDKPKDPSKIKNDYYRYPWAGPEDYPV